MVAKNKTILGKIWDFFTSLRLTIFLLIILALTSIIGTVIPQNAPLDQYLKIYEHSTYHIFEALGFLDLYHAWWFLLLLVLLSVNLIACSSRRFPPTWRRLRQNKVALDEDLLKGLPFKENFTKNIASDTLKETYITTLSKYFTKPTVTHTEDAHHLFSEKGKYSSLGVYIVHLSILIILLGGILGIFFGYEGYMELVEGETKGEIFLRKSNIISKLGFSVRCDNFEVSFYDDSKQPKDYKSTLTIIDQGKEVLSKTIEVNSPLKYQGIYFYQASYGTTLQDGVIGLLVTSKKEGGQSKEYQLKVGESVEIKGEGAKITALRFVPDFMIDQGRVVSKSKNLVNPAVEVLVSKNDATKYSTWIFQNFPNFHASKAGDFDFKFLNYEGKQYTGLQVAKDPGVWVVWIGCILLVLGILVAFFISHRRVWLRIASKDTKSSITLAGTSNKNREGFERDFKELTNKIKGASE